MEVNIIMQHFLSEELHNIYEELDRELLRLAPSCQACGRCCRFEEFGHVLFATRIETDYIIRHAGPPKGPLSQGVCPYLSGKECTVRQYRTLGCRVFFCQKDWQGVDIYHTYYRKIKALSLRYGLQWRYAPMLKLLSEAASLEGCYLE